MSSDLLLAFIFWFLSHFHLARISSDHAQLVLSIRIKNLISIESFVLKTFGLIILIVTKLLDLL